MIRVNIFMWFQAIFDSSRSFIQHLVAFPIISYLNEWYLHSGGRSAEIVLPHSNVFGHGYHMGIFCV